MSEAARPLDGALAAFLVRVVDNFARALGDEASVRQTLGSLGVSGPAADPAVAFAVSRSGDITRLDSALPALLAQLTSSSPDLLAIAGPAADLWATVSSLAANGPTLALPDLPDAGSVVQVLLSQSIEDTLRVGNPAGWAFARSLGLVGADLPVLDMVSGLLGSPTAFLWQRVKDQRRHLDITLTGILTGPRASSVITSPLTGTEVDPDVVAAVPSAAQVLGSITLRVAPDTYDDPFPIQVELLGTAADPPGFAAAVVRVEARTEPLRLSSSVAITFTPPNAVLGVAVTGFGSVVPITPGAPRMSLETSFATGFTFGPPGGLRLALGKPVLDPYVSGTDWGLRVGMDELELTIPQDVAGPVLAILLPSDGIRIRGKLVVAVDSAGIHLDGGVGLKATWPETIRLPGLVMKDLVTEITTQGTGLSFSASGVTIIELGPLTVTVEGLGLTLGLELRENGDGNLGPLQLGEPGVRMPTGLGVSLDAGIVKGGGFLRITPEEVSGALELTLALGPVEIAVKAVGIIGSVGGKVSFVVVMSVQFSPPIEIFLGLTLNAVGGVFGLNRTLDEDGLTALVRSGRMNDVMFPDDLAARAAQVVDSVRTVFPPRVDQFVVGPMLKLGWGRPVSFVTISVGIVLTLPDPVIIAIVGELRIVLPTPDVALIDLRAGFSGSINFTTGDVRFDASLAGSRIASFDISGDIALRAGPQGFLFTAGGFHPKFTPPASLGPVRRLAVAMMPQSVLAIRAEAYFAVTASTVQFGGALFVEAELGPLGVHGHLGMDVLIHFEPRFSFIAELSGQFGISWDGDDILSAQLDVLLEGPGRWHARAHASIHFLFITVSGTLELSWGDNPPEGLGAAVDVDEVVRKALDADSVWSHVIPAADGGLVTLRDGAGALHPLGRLRLTQTVAPVGLPLARFGSSAVVNPAGVSVTVTADGIATPQPAQELFATAQFFLLSDEEKLSKPAFVPYLAGYVVQGDRWLPIQDPVTVDVVYEESTGTEPTQHSRTRSLQSVDATFLGWTAVGAAGRAHPTSTQVAGPLQGLVVKDVTYAVADASRGAVVGAFGVGEVMATSMRAGADRVVLADYELAGRTP